ncbi:MAG: hypothetical protein MZU91_06950 [Desulfosudis oleivorans]|nr:hypothetical protein [Desulfosudis oleivorans]
MSCVRNSTNQNYEITISGETYTTNSYVTTVTPEGLSAYMVMINGLSGKLIVTIFNSGGGKTQTGFSFERLTNPEKKEQGVGAERTALTP